MTTTGQPDPTFEPEFIVVGSGAGGGTVAARLIPIPNLFDLSRPD